MITIVFVSIATCAPRSFDGRSVRPLSGDDRARAAAWYARKESTALFVGVRKFSRGDTPDVPYAVDDAVDLAYTFALERRTALVLPQRVVLALSGKPQKEESKRRLRELEEAGAQVRPATQSDILSLLRQQAATAGKNGIVIVSFATHGFLRDGVPYLLGEASVFEFPQTALAAATVLEMAATSPAARSLILIDACRNRLGGTRGGESNLNTAAAHLTMVRRMARTTGQAVFYAAAAGEYAYDDPKRQNGVFTAAVLDGLQCNAALSDGVVNAQNLETYVDGQVRKWIRLYKHQAVSKGIQVTIDGGARNMPLACCRPPCFPATLQGPILAVKEGSLLRVTDGSGVELWKDDAGAAIDAVEVADLDADGNQEVVASVRGGGGRGGRLLVFNRNGRQIGGADEPLTLQTFIIGDLARKGRRSIVAIWTDDKSSASRLSVYDGSGKLVSTYEHQGHLQYVSIARASARHDPRLVVTGLDARGEPRVFLLHPKKLASGKPVWTWTPPARIQGVDFIDVDGDEKNEIAVSTADGRTILGFNGKVVAEQKTRK